MSSNDNNNNNKEAEPSEGTSMPVKVNNSSDTQKAPGKSGLDWLGGGLLWGNNKNNKGGMLDGIDNSTDIASLLTGIDENFKEILQQHQQKASVETEATSSNADNENKQDEEEPEFVKLFAARLSRIRFLLYDERRQSSPGNNNNNSAAESNNSSNLPPPKVAETTVQAVTSESLRHLMPMLLEHLHILEFESRKHVAAIFNYLLVCGVVDGSSDTWIYVPTMAAFRDYVQMNFETIMTSLIKGHVRASKSATSLPDVGLHCGSMFRSCCRHASLYGQLVCTTERVQQFVFPFLDHFVHVPDFDVSSDAMESVRFVMTGCGAATNIPQQQLAQIQHVPQFQMQLQEEQYGQQRIAQMIAEFLVRDYDEIFNQRFNPKLLNPKSTTATYMTRRVALQILSAVLLTRSNYHIMIQYVAERNNLKLVLLLLRDTSPHLTLDAFNVFKVFVANPNKPPDVIQMLTDNRVKLCRYLQTLHQEREASDIQFREEKKLIVATIEAL